LRRNGTGNDAKINTERRKEGKLEQVDENKKNVKPIRKEKTRIKHTKEILRKQKEENNEGNEIRENLQI